MHTVNRKRVKRANKERAELVAIFMGKNYYFPPMKRELAERTAKAIAHGLDLWAWQQARVQFLSPKQIDLAMAAGLGDVVAEHVNGSDSADPFFTIHGGWNALQKYFPDIFAVHSRCAGRMGDHSCWAYGPVYTSKEAAKAAGHSHKCNCNCGRIYGPL